MIYLMHISVTWEAILQCLTVMMDLGWAVLLVLVLNMHIGTS